VVVLVVRDRRAHLNACGSVRQPPWRFNIPACEVSHLLPRPTMPLAARIESAVSRSSHRAQQFIGRLFSKRGTPTALDGKDELLAFDNTAFKVKGKWTAEFVISIFSKRDDEIAHKLEEEILALFGISKDAVEWSRFKYFIAIPRQNVIVDLKMVDGKEPFTVGPTEYNGIMSSELAFPIDGHTWVHGEATKFEVVPQNGFDQRPNFTTFFAEDRGIGVISGNCF
jgi:hypothetical protein